MSQFSFNAVSTVHKRRSYFDLSRSIKTSMNVGTLYPIQVREVLPGDTFKEQEDHVVRLTSSFIRPVMDNYFMDVYNFFVPCRILYDDFIAVMGENKKTKWSQNVKYLNPVSSSEMEVVSGSIADYMGLPVGKIPPGINMLPFRAFALIYDEWFRNENVIDPILIHKGSDTSQEGINGNAWSSSNYTGMPPKIAKKKDYFTSALPSPQKGDPVPITPYLGKVPLKGYGEDNNKLAIFTERTNNVDVNHITPAYLYQDDGTFMDGGGFLATNGFVFGSDLASGPSDFPSHFTPLNYALYADTRDGYIDLGNAAAANVNDLRLAFQIQRMLELDARGGTRYREYLRSHYGVDNADARMQVPEFLGGRRTPLNTQQVAQTAQSTDDALATLGAFSHSIGKSRYTKSFSEHGFVLTVAAIRTLHTYQQGIEKMWFRTERNDYYDPLFAHIGEQPIYTSQLMAAGQSSLKQNIFGYNEAWAEYRYSPSMITGKMRTGVSESLDVYHFGDQYVNAPVLSQDFIEETPIFFDRTLSVPSTSLDNFVVDFYFDTKVWHVMPVFSDPGLIDHTY